MKLKPLNSSLVNTSQLYLTQLNTSQLNSTLVNSTWLNSTQLNLTEWILRQTTLYTPNLEFIQPAACQLYEAQVANCYITIISQRDI